MRGRGPYATVVGWTLQVTNQASGVETTNEAETTTRTWTTWRGASVKVDWVVQGALLGQD
jgi:hypothetical protein